MTFHDEESRSGFWIRVKCKRLFRTAERSEESTKEIQTLLKEKWAKERERERERERKKTAGENRGGFSELFESSKR